MKLVNGWLKFMRLKKSKWKKGNVCEIYWKRVHSERSYLILATLIQIVRKKRGEGGGGKITTENGCEIIPWDLAICAIKKKKSLLNNSINQTFILIQNILSI